MIMSVDSVSAVEAEMRKLEDAAAKAHLWIAQQSAEPMSFLKSVKFEKRGFHPISHEPINLIEQVNQTWTYAVALAATRWLLERHPEAGGFHLAPGAHMSQDLDIMSKASGLIGAEVFAATSPRSNGKLEKDLAKLRDRAEEHRYVFFCCPRYEHNQQHEKLQRFGIQVWSLEV